MAYQARQRDPLFDSDTQAFLERRGREIVGLALIATGVLIALVLGSYSPDDPSWLSATDAPASNLLGRFGSSLASPLFIIAGLASWSLSALTLIWGARFLIHRGSERVVARIIFAPIAVALASIYASTHVPYAAWAHSFGLGGLFGDTVLGALLGVLPVSTAMGLKIMALVSAVAASLMILFVLGFTQQDLRNFTRFLVRSLGVVYVAGMRGFAALCRALLRGIVGGVAWSAQRRENREKDLDAFATQSESLAPKSSVSIPRAEPDLEVDRPALIARAKGLLRRSTKEEEVAPQFDPEAFEGQDRVRARIAHAVRARAGDAPTSGQPVAAHQRVEPRLTASSFDPDPFGDVIDQGTLEPELVDNPMPLVAEPLFETGRGGSDAPRVQHTKRRATSQSRKAKNEAQPSLRFEDGSTEFEAPPLSLLQSAEIIQRQQLSDEALEENARMLESVLDDYGVKGNIVSVRPGPVVTMYELEPAPGLKASRVIGLSDDIARSMSALSARVSTVPGRSVIGIELPNAQREKVMLREILSARDFGDSNMRLPLALGKDIGGEPVVANLSKMPHLLIAGTTGSGKSVAINTMILSLLYKLTPEECRLIMIDPKMLELSVYDGIPHLLSPVVTDPKKAVVALKWVVGEMEERYRRMSKMGVRNIEGYNSRVRDALSKNEMFSRTVQTGFNDETGEPIFETEEFAPETIPYIVVIVDEMADLMMVAGKEIEACIQRLAQMARASGIHLIMATQRPSVDVITGTIKANFPTRISFQVTSKVDSRTILGEMGAEQLLGMGDMLYMAGGAKITRVHGPFVSDEEVEEVVSYLKSFGAPEYMSGVTDGPDGDKESDIDLVLGLSTGGNTGGEDALYDQAVSIVLQDRKCSTSYIQRKLAIGYNKAARLVEQMEDSGLVSPANHVGKREILVPEQ